MSRRLPVLLLVAVAAMVGTGTASADRPLLTGEPVNDAALNSALDTATSDLTFPSSWADTATDQRARSGLWRLRVKAGFLPNPYAVASVFSVGALAFTAQDVYDCDVSTIATFIGWSDHDDCDSHILDALGTTVGRWFGLKVRVGDIPYVPTGASATVREYRWIHAGNTSISAAGWSSTYNRSPWETAPCGGAAGTNVEPFCENFPGTSPAASSWMLDFYDGNKVNGLIGSPIDMDRCSFVTINASESYSFSSGTWSCTIATQVKADNYMRIWSTIKSLVAGGDAELWPRSTADATSPPRYGAFRTQDEMLDATVVTSEGTSSTTLPRSGDWAYGSGRPGGSFTAATPGSTTRAAVRAMLPRDSEAEVRCMLNEELDASWMATADGQTICPDGHAPAGVGAPDDTDTGTGTGTTTVTGTVTTFVPFALLRPNPGEWYQDYLERLREKGWLGDATVSEEGSPHTGYQPGEVYRARTSTPATELDPHDWPTSAVPRIETPTEDVIIRTNPGEPVVTSGVPDLDFTPVASLDPGCKFPYGFVCYAQDVTGWFNVTPDAPSFSFDLDGTETPVGDYDLGTYGPVDLNVIDEYMTVWRTLLSIALWVGAVYYLATRLLGFGAGGDPGAAIDDVL